MKYLLTIMTLLMVQSVFTQDLVYEPVNPAFGGDTFNYQWLLSSAESQNTIQGDQSDLDGFGSQSELERLTESINQQFFNQVTRELFTNQFGEDGLQPGNYNVGSLSVEIQPSTTGLAISILDTATGESTTLIIPYF